jgi:alpha-galactosidase/6-phospho-beta-glucosidase family protein
MSLGKSRSLFVKVLLADGSVVNTEVVRQMGDELVEAHQQYLPNFFESGAGDG